jgi:hypothetical protein
VRLIRISYCKPVANDADSRVVLYIVSIIDEWFTVTYSYQTHIFPIDKIGVWTSFARGVAVAVKWDVYMSRPLKCKHELPIVHVNMKVYNISYPRKKIWVASLSEICSSVRTSACLYLRTQGKLNAVLYCSSNFVFFITVDFSM